MIDTKIIKPFHPELPFKPERGPVNFMSTPKIYGLIRFLVEKTKGPYLEIGSYRGQSLLAAGKDNKISCVGIDNFTGTGHQPENKEICLKQIAPYRNIKLIVDDYREAIKTLSKKKKYGVIFLDGPHEKDTTLYQIEFASKRVKKNGFIIIDDLNFTPVALALDEFLNSENGKAFKIVLNETTYTKTDPVWWNGVAVIQKK